jgi:hypothetical protein
LACQLRTGSAFSAQARWRDSQVSTEGEFREWERVADSGDRAIYRFCPICGSTVSYANEGLAGMTAVPIGAFADPCFPAPDFSVYERSQHSWTVILGDGVNHSTE